MIVNIRIEISDEQRNTLACAIAGKAVKRLATREDVTAYVEGAIARIEVKAEDSVDSQLARPLPIVERLRAEGRSDDYITSYLRGWAAAGKTAQSRTE